jgi:hypothetical protein
VFVKHIMGQTERKDSYQITNDKTISNLRISRDVFNDEPIKKVRVVMLTTKIVNKKSNVIYMQI